MKKIVISKVTKVLGTLKEKKITQRIIENARLRKVKKSENEIPLFV